MICKACGRETQNENANFCEYCGASYREKDSFQQLNGMKAPMEQQLNMVNEQYKTNAMNHSNALNSNVLNSNVMNPNMDEGEKPISFLNWVGTMLLPCIPLIGIFVWLVMLFVWAFGSETPKSKKNWARATLLVIVIAIVLLTALIGSSVMDILNSGLTMDEYMKQITEQAH